MHDGNELLDDVSEILNSLSACQSLVRETEQQLTQIRLSTSGFDILCRCNLHGERLSDVLNQQLTSFLECVDVQLFRHGQLIDVLPHLKIRKPEILIAGIHGNTHEAAEKRIGNRRALQQYHAVASVGRWLVKGRLHLTSQKTVQEFLRANRDFFPISEALLIDSESPQTPDDMSVAIVNHSRVAFMEIMEAGDQEEAPGGLTAVLQGSSDAADRSSVQPSV